MNQSARSSNLRVKKTFTDHDKSRFLTEAFEYIANYFEGSLRELAERNPEIDVEYRRIDAINLAQPFQAFLRTNCHNFYVTELFLRQTGLLRQSPIRHNGYYRTQDINGIGLGKCLRSVCLRRRSSLFVGC
jgi:hypothetical protein